MSGENIGTEHDNTIRLQVYISKSGICSRRAAATLIEEGRVAVNKKVVLIPGYRVSPNIDKVSVEGKLCVMSKSYAYLVMNKPRKVESTNKSYSYNSHDSEHRRTVRDIISRYYDGHIFSVGRLDYHSSGLLIFTTDGELCNRLSHPRYEINKKYVLETKSEMTEHMLEKWKQGLKIQGELYTLFKYYKNTYNPLKVELTLKEGKNREIRNVCEYFHIFVKKLHRIECGPISLYKLKGGQVRSLSTQEIISLYKAVNLDIPPDL